MPHAVLDVSIDVDSLTFHRFRLSAPREVKRSIAAKFASVGNFAGGSWDGNEYKMAKGKALQLHTLLDWMESDGWYIQHMSRGVTPISGYTHTYVLNRAHDTCTVVRAVPAQQT